ncbi:MAG: hypothetical protein BZ151_07180 [Desulfobacca sp. 4484_104]|nr:MAG: hypothetical protein BZ151_07180 [Desulfobacca sp. 4484_104]RLA88186.1 MAG: hypothetical protein DRG58_08730 [Deltaproteobacteria bacterium]
MPQWYHQMLIISLVGILTGCTPLQLGLGLGKLCTSLVRSAVQSNELKQYQLECHRMQRIMYPEDFLDVGDPLAKAIARLGPPTNKEAGMAESFYFFPKQRIIDQSGQVLERDLRLAVDGEEKITKIEILEPAPPEARGGNPREATAALGNPA